MPPRPKSASSPAGRSRPASAFVRLRTDDGEEARVALGREMQRAAMAWSYVVRNRQRWLSREGAREQQAERARRQLQALGLKKRDLEVLDRARVLEVTIPYRDEAVGWEARVLPWESMLAAATSPRRQAPLLVVRRLERADRRVRLAPGTQPVLLVESAPGPLAEAFDFDLERRLVEASLRSKRLESLDSPDALGLAARVAETEPCVVHLSGLDAHEARAILDLDGLGEGDGFLVAGPAGQPVALAPGDLARAVNAGDRKPRLLVCSFGSSAPRIAALCVAEGCGAALGFQDEMDQTLVENLLADFYTAWRLTEGDALRSFEAAFASLRGRPELAGAGVVLWSASPLLEAKRETGFELPRGRQPRRGSARELIGVEARPVERLNYALLHNDRDLFESFRLLNYSGGRIEGVSVEVTLHAGSEPLTYRALIDLTRPVTDLGSRVRVPLTSTLARSVREAVHTTLEVVVSWRGEAVASETHRVTLLPADEWRDDDQDRMWLPGFVLPRDPAVESIVTAAEPYLRVLRDDPGAGFDGYQARDAAAIDDDPCAGVDLQARALWSAIALDMGLAYINPPPTYTASSQRLRTPTQVLRGRKGTCLDLALLLAACLESVDVHPVLFLLEGHALPGYWRSPEAHAVFESVGRPEAEARGDDAYPPGQRVAWQSYGHREMLAPILAGELVPLETVVLTRRGSFREARALGLDRLRSGEGFEALVDVALARRQGVTPIPIREDEP